jgi:RNA polymerase sigma-70 factor (ECF subfamily)
MTESEPRTLTLLRRWHEGDREALGELIARDLPWIREHVHRRLGPGLRAHADTNDFVQDAFVEVLRTGPRFLVSDQEHFRALLARIVENVLRMRHRHLHRQRRDVAKEQRIGSGAVLDLDGSQTRPSQAAIRSESESWLQLGLELLDAEDREVVLLRQWDGLSFTEVGQRLNIAEDAARMRFSRALARLARLVKRLRGGELAAVLSETPGGR